MYIHVIHNEPSSYNKQCSKKWTTQELVGYVEVMDQTPYLVGGNSEWDPGANQPFFPCLSMALVLWTAENSYARLDYSIIYTCT